MTRVAARLLPWVAALVGPSCGKVPIEEVESRFAVADAAWFAEEGTLFVFAEVRADQGLGADSVLEATWTTDQGTVDWTPLAELPSVHTHLPVDCGPRAKCASASVRVDAAPRDVGLRLRWHRDGELALVAPTVYNAVGRGDPATHRSLAVYGVFDEQNRHVQWRARHQFPTIRNEQAEALGLRRWFRVEAPTFGAAPDLGRQDPYGYGARCPSGTPWDAPPVETEARAVFVPEPVPDEAGRAAAVCGRATVTDAFGTFTTDALARKNPQVRDAFPELRSPLRDARVVPFFLAPCERTLSVPHERMQRQRLLVDDLPATCTEGWDQPDFVPRLVAAFRDAIEAARTEGRDLVLVVGIHQDEAGVASAVEDALAAVVPAERHRTTPRLAGAFVFDSTVRGPSRPDLGAVALWCPSTLPIDELPDASQRSCPTLPDALELELGPFSIATLPILPSRAQYLDFLDTYSAAQAGEVEALAFRTPEFAASARHVDYGPFGVVTFLNDEAIDADPDDAFSWCAPDEFLPVVFGSETLSQASAVGLDPALCEAIGLPASDCQEADVGVLPIEALPGWHDLARERSYDLGVFWEFPFLLRMRYRAVAAGAVSAFGLSVPFGVGDTARAFYGSAVWTADVLPLGGALGQCRRFCDHPTFDSAGVYHPRDPYRSTYATSCYEPRFPRPGDDGFPRDP